MEDIFHWCREGNAFQVRVWLDDTENDLNLGDDHGFSPLHWSAKEGRANIVEMLILRGARINATNMGDDTALHLASAHGHRDIVHMLLRNKADINAINEHGNTPLHYACFWGYQAIAEDLINNGSMVSICNKYGETALDKCKGQMSQKLHELAVQLGQDTKKILFKDENWLGTKTRSRDATLSRHSGINMKEISFEVRIANTPSGETWKGLWQKNHIVAKILKLRETPPRVTRDFNDEYPRLRIFSHPNVLPVIGCVVTPPSHIVINQYMPFGSLSAVLHEDTGIVVDTAQALKFAIDICRGMAFLHTLDPLIPRFYLSSKHVMAGVAQLKFIPTEQKMSRPGIEPEYLACRANALPVKLSVRYLADIIHSYLLDMAVNCSDISFIRAITIACMNYVSQIDEELTARINMGDAKFSFQEKGKMYSPAWMAPEALQKKQDDINVKAADMWSYAILLWELATREVPFADLSPMECGMKIALEGLRITIPPGISQHMSRLIRICMNEDAGKRPTFDMILPILEKMKQ